MYKSPIHMYLTDIQEQLHDSIEEQAYQCIKKVGIFVDKDELIKALQYDRQQYIQGYHDARAEIIRCRDCEYGKQDYEGEWFCRNRGFHMRPYDGSGFCSEAERRTDD